MRPPLRTASNTCCSSSQMTRCERCGWGMKFVCRRRCAVPSCRQSAVLAGLQGTVASSGVSLRALLLGLLRNDLTDSLHHTHPHTTGTARHWACTSWSWPTWWWRTRTRCVDHQLPQLGWALARPPAALVISAPPLCCHRLRGSCAWSAWRLPYQLDCALQSLVCVCVCLLLCLLLQKCWLAGFLWV